MLSILLVEDDHDLATTLIDYLELEGLSCDYAANGIEACRLIEQQDYHVVILDINIPGIDGFGVCEHIRKQGIATPVLMLTARDTLESKLAGFDAGSDDYLVKPFEIEELMARIKVLSRRKSGQLNVLQLGTTELNTKTNKCRISGEEVKLTPFLFKLLLVLIRATPEPVAQPKILQEVWGEDTPDSNSLRVHIYKLRKLLDNADADIEIKTESGFGFSLQLKE